MIVIDIGILLVVTVTMAYLGYASVLGALRQQQREIEEREIEKAQLAEIQQKTLEREKEECRLAKKKQEARLIALFSNFGDPLNFTRIIWNATQGMEERIKLNRTEFRCLLEDPNGDVMAFYGSCEDLSVIKNRLEAEGVSCKIYFSRLTNF